MIDTIPQHTIVAVIVGMGVVNFCLRFIPMAALSRIALPKSLMRWLSFVPISVMGALFAKEVLLPSTEYSPMAANPGIYGALVSMLVFKLSKSFIGSTLAGVGFYLMVRWVFTLAGFGV